MKNFKPMSIEEYGNSLGNCMLFAFGETAAKMDPKYDLTGLSYRSAEEVVIEAARKFANLELRKIENEKACPNDRYLIAFYSYSPLLEYSALEYHFVRRELDGTWVEKPNWSDSPCKADMAALRFQFMRNPIFFVVEGVI